MKYIIKDMGLDDKTFPAKYVLSVISREKDKMVSAGMFMDRVEATNDVRLLHIARAYVRYQTKLKENNAVLKVFFSIAGTQLGAEYILNNMDEVLRNDRPKYSTQIEEHFAGAVSIGYDYEINTTWEEQSVV